MRERKFLAIFQLLSAEEMSIMDMRALGVSEDGRRNRDNYVSGS